MHWLARLRRRLRLLVHRGAVDREIDEELRIHLEMESEELMRFGAWFLAVGLLCLEGCATIGALSAKPRVIIVARESVRWTASVGSADGGSSTFSGAGNDTIPGYECAAVAKQDEFGELCVRIVRGEVATSRWQCTTAPYGSVSVCEQ